MLGSVIGDDEATTGGTDLEAFADAVWIFNHL